MKLFTVAVAVALMITFICIQRSSAVPAAEGAELMMPTDDRSLAVDQDMPDDSLNSPYDSVQMHHHRCRFCCGCCPNMIGCGTCCKF